MNTLKTQYGSHLLQFYIIFYDKTLTLLINIPHEQNTKETKYDGDR